MDEKVFMSKMQDILSLAKLNNREVTKEFLQDYLKDLDISEKHMEYVYEYLKHENIRIRGYVTKKKESEEKIEESLEVSESEYLDLYMKELGQFSNKEIEEECYKRASAGDDTSKKIIIEAMLKTVTIIAQEFKKQGVAVSDLIQEGNLGLLLAVESLSGIKEQDELFIKNEIRNAMAQAIEEYRGEKKENRNLLNKAESLKEEMERMEEDFGDKMTSEDIADFTGMSIGEIQKILRLTGEDL